MSQGAEQRGQIRQPQPTPQEISGVPSPETTPLSTRESLIRDDLAWFTRETDATPEQRTAMEGRVDTLILTHLWPVDRGLFNVRINQGPAVGAIVGSLYHELTFNEGDEGYSDDPMQTTADTYAVPRDAVEAARVYARKHQEAFNASVVYSEAMDQVDPLFADQVEAREEVVTITRINEVAQAHTDSLGILSAAKRDFINTLYGDDQEQPEVDASTIGARGFPGQSSLDAPTTLYEMGRPEREWLMQGGSSETRAVHTQRLIGIAERYGLQGNEVEGMVADVWQVTRDFQGQLERDKTTSEDSRQELSDDLGIPLLRRSELVKLLVGLPANIWQRMREYEELTADIPEDDPRRIELAENNEYNQFFAESWDQARNREERNRLWMQAQDIKWKIMTGKSLSERYPSEE